MRWIAILSVVGTIGLAALSGCNSSFTEVTGKEMQSLWRANLTNSGLAWYYAGTRGHWHYFVRETLINKPAEWRCKVRISEVTLRPATIPLTLNKKKWVVLSQDDLSFRLSDLTSTRREAEGPK